MEVNHRDSFIVMIHASLWILGISALGFYLGIQLVKLGLFLWGLV
jgi:hypothetical protein